MKWKTGEQLQFTIGDQELEGRCWGPSPDTAPTLVLLHEGLGSVGLWKDIPERLAERTGYGVFAYSRAGYGNSSPVALPRPLDFMTREAVNVLPEVLDAIGLERGVLIGHSDGASIAAIYAGQVSDFRVRAICLISPHFFTEPEGLTSITQVEEAYETKGLRERLARHHADPDNAFYGWCNAWLDPGFKAWNIEEVLAFVRVPVLAIQGRDDQYGTLAQIKALETGLQAPLDVEIIEDCGHSPHLEHSDKTLLAISDFVTRLDRIEAAQVQNM